MTNLQVTLLGTGSPIPDPACAGPSSLVSTETTKVLVDAGRGVTMRLAAAAASPAMLDAILLTHLHSDHICALNDVVTTAWVTSPIERPITIYGPPGTAQVVAGMQMMLAPDVSYRLAHHDDLVAPPELVVHEVGAGERFDVGDMSLRTGRTDHKPVEPTVGYRIELESEAIVLAGDGVPCDSLDELCADADIYVQTVVREDLIRPFGYQRFTDILDYHSTVEDAARTAARARVGTLVMTHMVPAVAPGTSDDWIALAAQNFDGTVLVGHDNLVISPKRP